ncbi:hypothetical protein DQ04_00141010 [Trypanosoma grayi]|uniref:hypothetical protein n=1 Tax=Trypanosoma grayi TaxID=71804 RepID=UPI0004F44E5F|nr:hypothetical protein DQ04_00141010 [Trypanosoma grayi]KEG15213.1 hypothetical protein DQ04_00141010 [Trypanosoma grayi]
MTKLLIGGRKGEGSFKDTVEEGERRGKSGRAPSLTVEQNAAPPVMILLRKAEELLRCWQELDDVMVNRKIGHGQSSPHTLSASETEALSLQQQRDMVFFTAKAEVFAVLKALLPPVQCRGGGSGVDAPPQNYKRETETHAGRKSVGGLAVIPDEATADVGGYLQQLGTSRLGDGKGGESFSSDTQRRPAVLSMKDIVVFLQLYHALECEDGILLLQLMEELQCIVLAPKIRSINEDALSNKGHESAVPQVLLVMSGLGLVEEFVLQALIRPSGPFLSPAEIARLHESDLVRLLVALHRFGLHQEPCFKSTTKVLRQRAHRKPLKSFIRPHLAHPSGAPPSDAAKSAGIPACVVGLTVNELLEGISAVALSVHREKAVVEFLSAIIIAAVEVEERNSASITRERVDAHEHNLGLLRTLQVHRAAKLCEQMQLEQPALAHLLHRLSIRHGGLLVDGGETAMNPERVGFFDAITADLVKVCHS